MRVPLAWQNLLHEPSRLTVAIAGVSFAVLLVFMNLGFLGGLEVTASQFYTRLNGDIFLISPQTPEISAPKPFAIERLYSSGGVDGVERVMPLYTGFLPWRNPETRVSRTLFIYAINPNDPVFLLPEFEDPALSRALYEPNTVIFDTRSRSEFGPQAIGTETEMDGRQVRINGHYTLGGGFAADGTAIIGDVNFRRYFSRRPENLIDLGIIKLEPGADAVAVRDHLREILPEDVEVYTNPEMVERERDYWINTTSTGFIFGMGVTVSLIVGAVIVYQILYTDIADRLPEYATLKAMGYRNQYLIGLVLQSAVILAVLGYVPGFLASLGLYNLAVSATDGTLPLEMTSDRAINVLTMTLIMCALSGLVALQKVVTADPAEVF